MKYIKNITKTIDIPECKDALLQFAFLDKSDVWPNLAVKQLIDGLKNKCDVGVKKICYNNVVLAETVEIHDDDETIEYLLVHKLKYF